MARQPAGRSKANNGSSSARRGLYVAVLPIQLRHVGSPSDLAAPPLKEVAFPEAEFEDCSSYIDLDLFQLSKGKRRSSFEVEDNSDDDVIFVKSTNDKRKAVPKGKSSLKMSRIQAPSIAETVCRFQAYISDDCHLDTDELCNNAADIAYLTTSSRPGSDDESFLSRALELYNSEDRLIASLPVVNTDLFPSERDPHRLSNGTWLESLVALCGRVVAKPDSSKGLSMSASVKVDRITRPQELLGMQLITLSLNLRIYFYWESFSESATPANAEQIHRVMRFCYPNDEVEELIRSHDSVSASLIYSLLPSSQWPAQEEVQPMALHPSLFPFQRRSVNFLLGREGKKIARIDEDGEVHLEDVAGVVNHKAVGQIGLLWQQIDHELYYSPLLGKVTDRIAATRENDVAGGILAEEMGLGKTVEVLALVLLNPDESRSDLPAYYDDEQELSISPTKTTLIVAPETLRQQWIDEIALHAPSLRTFSYLGYKEAIASMPEGSTWQDWSKRFDIIVVSFDTLRKEINVARKAPSRSRRFERKYERQRCPLIQLDFHRVIMDEVQLVGHSSAAETVSMIERRYSLAVSGTPVKTFKDLKSLFHFLRILPRSQEKYWDRLQDPSMLPTLKDCFNMLATRHTKAQVKSEMTLPLQTRVLVPITFTAIESAFYRDIYSLALQSLGVDPTTFSSSQSLLDSLRARFGEDMNQLHGSLVSLRQACTHPQIAGTMSRSNNYHGGTALGTSNTIRSMDEVLTIMIEGTRADQALVYLQSLRKRINRAVLLLQDKKNEARLDIAREMLKAVIPQTNDCIAEVERDMQRAKYVGPLYRFTKSEVESNTRENSIAPTPEEADDVVVQVAPSRGKTQLEREKEEEVNEKKTHQRHHFTALNTRWRFFTEELHRAHHFLGNVYYQLGEAKKAPDSRPIDVDEPASEMDTTEVSPEVAALKKQEDDAYNAAEEVRQRLLRQARRVVDNALPALDKTPVNFPLEKLFEDVELGQSGIYTVATFDRAEATQDLLSAQTELLLKWRQEILKRIRMPVSRDVSDEDENDDQYQENLDAQSEAEVFTEMYRLLLNEREYLLTGIRIEGSISRPALYIELERHFKTKERLEQLRLDDPQNENVLRQLERAPTEAEESAMSLQLEHFRRLEQERKEVLQSYNFDESKYEESVGSEDEYDEEGNSEDEFMENIGKKKLTANGPMIRQEMTLDTIIRDIRDKMLRMEEVPEEVAIAKSGIEKIRRLISSQKVLNEKMKREHNLMMILYNARSAYFKHIQQLSDHVGDIITSDIHRELQSLEQEEVNLKKRMETIAGRLRYLSAIEEEEGAADDENKESTKEAAGKTCFICTEPLNKAVIFNTCGHSTCENCFKSWTLPKKQCPMCKTRVMPRDAYHVTYSNDGKGKKRQVQLPRMEKSKRQEARYNVISKDLLKEMSVMPIKSALGSKLDLLTRHLLYIEHSKPGTKSLIFTAFSRGITLVGDALRLNHIKFVTLDQGGAKSGRIVDKFKNDPSVNVLLLHSEAQSSGLNLNICENVFLLEPLVNHSIELQAIGRVHRIGQVNETTVFIYQVNDTVEERIVHLAAERGQSLVTKDNCKSKDLQDSAVMMAEAEGNKNRNVISKQGGNRRGEFVASVEEIYRCLFEDEGEEEVTEHQESQQASTSSSSVVSVIKMEDDERERMRKERVMAIERRQAMASLERER